MKSLDQLFEGVEKKLRIDFEEQASILAHRGETGVGRENVLKGLLPKYIPKRYGVESGFVIDAQDNKSKQMDIVIYESEHAPIFEIVPEKRFFPCETVVAVGQVRTDIGSKTSLNECFENIRSAKSLDRSNLGENQMITGPGISLQGVKFDPRKNYRDQIFGFIFCSSSIKPESIIEETLRFCRNNERQLWINTIVNYNEFLTMYRGNDQLNEDTMNAKELVLVHKTENPHLSAMFVSLLNNFLGIAHIARSNLFSYFNLRQIRHHRYPL